VTAEYFWPAFEHNKNPEVSTISPHEAVPTLFVCANEKSGRNCRLSIIFQEVKA